MSLYRSKLRFALAFVFLTSSIGVLGCDDSTSEAAEKAKSVGSEQAQAKPATDKPATDKPAKDEPAAADPAGETADAKKAAPKADDDAVVAGNIYPGFNFELLTPTERKSFVEIAEAELCPCPGSAESLHECMQKGVADRCGMAAQVAGVIGMGIREGLNQTDTLDRAAKFVAASKHRYEFTLEGVPYKGSKDAKVVLVEFADFYCSHCRDAAGLLKEVHEKYGDDVAIYFKNFPFRPESQVAAQAALAAHEQGKFWPMHDLIFKYQSSLNAQRIEGFAHQLGLNFERFKGDLKNPSIVAKVNRDRKEGEAANMTGTPAIFINGRTYSDAPTLAALSQAIDAELKEVNTKAE